MRKEIKFEKLTPDLMVSDVAETVKFYTEKLGFKLKMLVDDKGKTADIVIENNKKYTYAMVARDEVFVMFMHGKTYKKDIKTLKNAKKGLSGTLYCDIDCGVEELRNGFFEKGVKIVKDIENTIYRMKEFYIEDCNGYIIGFGEKIK